MECKNGSIPSRLKSEYFKNNEDYIDALYSIFKRDFIDRTIFFKGKPVDIIHQQLFDNKERSFWHIISEGDEDVKRTPISTRAECITQIRYLLEEDGTCSEYRIWRKYCDKTKRDRYYIWCIAINLMVILEYRNTFYKLITAYPVQECKIASYNKDYQKYCI